MKPVPNVLIVASLLPPPREPRCRPELVSAKGNVHPAYIPTGRMSPNDIQIRMAQSALGTSDALPGIKQRLQQHTMVDK